MSERIVAIINDGGFEFTPEYFVALHGKLFKGVLPTAGKIRKVNIRKHEWVLKGDSVTYGAADTIKQSLIRDFIDEREFNYGVVTPRKAIAHFARFIAQIWQVHPFGEGNTRTVAVFAVKYLASLGYRVSSNMFKDNSWFFRLFVFTPISVLIVLASLLGLVKSPTELAMTSQIRPKIQISMCQTTR